MRLINIRTHQLKEFWPGKIPRYAILSHTWGDDEPTMQEWETGKASGKQGTSKILGFIYALATETPNWVTHVWVDTCCIDKTSSAELSEAINSMYAWYRDAALCYVHLSDVSTTDHGPASSGMIASSRYFTRGWTLQEMLAPSYVEFFDRSWKSVGTLGDLCEEVYKATKIDPNLLRKSKSINDYSVAQKMSWASGRETTRPEDIAYCLLGLFDVNMPLLYGEGDKAFLRLQEEIIRRQDDSTIFAWSIPSPFSEERWSGWLAPSPQAFQDAGDMVEFRQSLESRPFVITNKGIEVSFLLARDKGSTTMILECGHSGYVAGTPIPMHLEGTKTWLRARNLNLKKRPIPISAKRETVFINAHQRDVIILTLPIKIRWSLISVSVGPVTSTIKPFLNLTSIYPNQRWSITEQSLLVQQPMGIPICAAALHFEAPGCGVTVMILNPFVDEGCGSWFALASDASGKEFAAAPQTSIWDTKYERLPSDKSHYHILRLRACVVVIKTSMMERTVSDRGVDTTYDLTFSSIAEDPSIFRYNSIDDVEPDGLSEAMDEEGLTQLLVDRYHRGIHQLKKDATQ